MTVGAGTALEASRPALGSFERYLTIWVALCIVTGIALGHTLPNLFGAIAALEFLRRFDSIFDVDGVHIERRCINEQARADEFLMQVMLPQHMANILAQEAFNTFVELLDAVNILLDHPPRALRKVRVAWFEGLDFFLGFIVPGNVGDQVFNQRKRPHRLHGDGRILGQLT